MQTTSPSSPPRCADVAPVLAIKLRVGAAGAEGEEAEELLEDPLLLLLSLLLLLLLEEEPEEELELLPLLLLLLLLLLLSLLLEEVGEAAAAAAATAAATLRFTLGTGTTSGCVSMLSSVMAVESMTITSAASAVGTAEAAVLEGGCSRKVDDKIVTLAAAFVVRAAAGREDAEATAAAGGVARALAANTPVALSTCASSPSLSVLFPPLTPATATYEASATLRGADVLVMLGAAACLSPFLPLGAAAAPLPALLPPPLEASIISAAELLVWFMWVMPRIMMLDRGPAAHTVSSGTVIRLQKASLLMAPVRAAAALAPPRIEEEAEEEDGGGSTTVMAR